MFLAQKSLKNPNNSVSAFAQQNFSSFGLTRTQNWKPDSLKPSRLNWFSVSYLHLSEIKIKQGLLSAFVHLNTLKLAQLISKNLVRQSFNGISLLYLAMDLVQIPNQIDQRLMRFPQIQSSVYAEV